MLRSGAEVNIGWSAHRNVRLVQMNETLKGLAVQRRVEQIAISLISASPQNEDWMKPYSMHYPYAHRSLSFFIPKTSHRRK